MWEKSFFKDPVSVRCIKFKSVEEIDVWTKKTSTSSLALFAGTAKGAIMVVTFSSWWCRTPNNRNHNLQTSKAPLKSPSAGHQLIYSWTLHQIRGDVQRIVRGRHGFGVAPLATKPEFSLGRERGENGSDESGYEFLKRWNRTTSHKAWDWKRSCEKDFSFKDFSP